MTISPTTAQDWHNIFAESGANYFFGQEASGLARTALRYWNEVHGARRVPLFDMGCGEGRDAVYFAQNGFEVTAVDGAEAGVEKTKRLAKTAGVDFSCILADILDLPLPHSLSFLHANNSLQFLGEACIPQLEAWQKATEVGGFHAVSVFTQACVEARAGIYRFEQNELKHRYENGWRIFYYSEEIVWREPSQKYLSFALLVAQKRE
jgi:SAM-dependent methyltransferase